VREGGGKNSRGIWQFVGSDPGFGIRVIEALVEDRFRFPASCSSYVSHMRENRERERERERDRGRREKFYGSN